MTKILTPKFNFSVIFLLISISLYRFNNPPQSQTIIPTPSLQQPVITRKNYIVRFTQYKKAEDHKAYLEQKIPYVSCSWEWINRNNPASKFPTDFGVVAIDNDAVDSIITKFETLDVVKDVRVDSSYHLRNLLGGTKNKRYNRVGAFVDGKKRPGKIFTSMSFTDGEDFVAAAMTANQTIDWNRHLLSKKQKPQVTSLFGADELWSKGYTGAKVKMAIFDTGIRSHHPHFRNIKERTNWTNEKSLTDHIGHGTFVAGVIASENTECLGFAPDAEIYAFRVFTDAQVSYTSWFLDAFNYAIATEMDVLNLSIGGPDNMDLPFVEKVWELTASNIIMVSAIGNDGPFYGTLNNPADQSDVIGVGGIDYSSNIASFSSRGMSTWEIPHGYGRVKPDVVAYGKDIRGSAIGTGCRTLSGTSVASPVVAGIVCLLVSVIPESERKKILNPASMKQTLVEGAVKLSGHSMYEQGAGRVNLLESYEILKNYKPRATIFPNTLDYTDCPYTWPFCHQPLYFGAMPILFNTTILNGLGPIGYFSGPPSWIPSTEQSNLLDIRFSYSNPIWPWTGHLSLHLQIKPEGSHFSGLISGKVAVHIFSPPAAGETTTRNTTCVLHLNLKVIPTPERSKRILFDQFHNIKYPPGYLPRDSLSVHNDILDWHGDHIHTNFHSMFDMLTEEGYFIETLGSPLTCFDPYNYGTLLMVDLEDEYFEEEVKKLYDDVVGTGLGLVVFGDWYNVDKIVNMRFFDDNTRSWWTPVTGGANVPALNELLRPFGIAFGDMILNGNIRFEHDTCRYASGCNIVEFPKGGYLHRFPLFDTAGNGPTNKEDVAVLGVVEVGAGRVAVYGDSNCLDSSHMVSDCFWLLEKMLDFTSGNIKDSVLFSNSVKVKQGFGYDDSKRLPSRRTDFNFSMYSGVIGKELVCGSDARFDVWGTKGYGSDDGLPRHQEEGVDLGSGLNLNSTTTSDYFIRKGFKQSRWFVPCAIAVFGIFFAVSLWRMRQKGRRKKKISGSSR